MTEIEDQDLELEVEDYVSEEQAALIDILTGEKVKPSAKKLLVQKVLQQLIESYGFDRNDLAASYKPKIPRTGNKTFDIAIFRPGTEHINDNVQRIIVCQTKKQAVKLRSFDEAAGDLDKLRELMQLIPSCHLGMWTNGFEEFFLQAEHTRFEVRFRPLGVWPAPGEATEDLDRTGGIIQITPDVEGMELVLQRCHRYLNRNLGLDHKDTFRQLAMLLLAKIYDETCPPPERRFWIKATEPFDPKGQAEIKRRIDACLKEALRWQPGLLTSGWDLNLDEAQTSRVVMELARFSFFESFPYTRTCAYRSVVRSVMDGREGRYPTPLNVAKMAVRMLDPKPNERLMDCASGTGTFLAMAASHVHDKFLESMEVNPDEATPEQLRKAQEQTGRWVSQNIYGAEIDPFLVATSRMNLLLTIGNPGQVFRLDARTFPHGDLDGVAEGSRAMPLGKMDIVLTNPWFSTQREDVVTDGNILQRYDLGKVWERTEDGGFRNTGQLKISGVPPEVLFLERALQWVKPGTGRIGILLPDGLLGNPGDEYVRWWILRHCEVLASIDLPVEPFKVTVKEYGLTPALCSFLVLRRRSNEELIQPEQSEYKVFMAVAEKAGVDLRGNILFQRAPDGEELIFIEEIIERVRRGGELQMHKVVRRTRRVRDELPVVAEKFRSFVETGEVN